MADESPRTPMDTGAIPVTAAIPQVAEQYQSLTSAAPPSRQSPEKVPAQLWVLILASFVIALGYGLIAPILPRYAASYDVGAMAASAVVSMFALTRLLFAPGAGASVTRFGERKTYITGLLIVALGSLGTAASSSYTSLMIFRALGGIGSVMFTVSAMGLLVRFSPTNLRGRISGYYATSFLLGNILGPVLGSMLAHLGMRLPFMLYGGALVIAAAAVLFFLKDTAETVSTLEGEKEQLRFRQAWKFSNYRAALTTNFAMGWAALGIRISLMPLAAVALLTSYYAGENYDPQSGGTVLAGVAMASYAACNAVMQNVSGTLSDRYGRRLLIFCGLLLAAGATLLVGYSSTPVWFVVFSALTGIGTGLLAPSLQASVADVIGSSRTGGQVLATFQMASDLGQIIGPILAGWIADSWGFYPAFAVSACLLLVSALGWLPKRQPKFPVELAEKGYTGR